MTDVTAGERRQKREELEARMELYRALTAGVARMASAAEDAAQALRHIADQYVHEAPNRVGPRRPPR